MMTRIRDSFVPVLILIVLVAAGKARGQDGEGRLNCICIDPGHGGTDPGTINGTFMEKHFALDISLKLGEMIQRAYPGMKIVYTRKTDVAVSLKGRGAIANKARAKLFISVHANGVEDSRANGTEVFVMGLHVSDESLQVAIRENNAIRYEPDYKETYAGFDPAREESYIFLNYMQGAYLDNSTKLATYIHDELVKALGTRKRGVKQAGFIVLKGVAMPTVLVETAFITNPGDLKKLNSAAEREKMARAIFNAFVTYKNELETNSAQVRYAPGVRDDAPGVTYAIQIASAKGRITNFKRFNLPEPARELHAGDRYCYYVRECSSYDEAVNAQRETRKSVKDCFVIAIRGGKLIPVAEARRVENERKK